MKYIYIILFALFACVYPCIFNMEKIGVCLIYFALTVGSFMMCCKKIPELFV